MTFFEAGGFTVSGGFGESGVVKSREEGFSPLRKTNKKWGHPTRFGRLNGWNLFYRSMRKEGVRDVSYVKRCWWHLEKSQREAVNSAAANLSTEEINPWQDYKQICDDGVVRYFCPHCGCKFVHLNHMRSHMKNCRYVDPDRTRCPHCEKRLANVHSLQRHIKIQHSTVNDRQSSISYPGPNARAIREMEGDEQLVTFIDGIPHYECKICGMLKMSKMAIAEHMDHCQPSLVKIEKSVAPSLISGRSRRKSNLTSERCENPIIRQLKPKSSITCPLCDAKILSVQSSQSVLEKHLSNFHGVAPEVLETPMPKIEPSSSLSSLVNAMSSEIIESSLEKLSPGGADLFDILRLSPCKR